MCTVLNIYTHSHETWRTTNARLPCASTRLVLNKSMDIYTSVDTMYVSVYTGSGPNTTVPQVNKYVGCDFIFLESWQSSFSGVCKRGLVAYFSSKQCKILGHNYKWWSLGKAFVLLDFWIRTPVPGRRKFCDTRYIPISRSTVVEFVL